MYFRHQFYNDFFRLGAILAPFWEALRPQNFIKNCLNNCKNHEKSAPHDFGHPGPILDGFSWIVNGFGLQQRTQNPWIAFTKTLCSHRNFLMMKPHDLFGWSHQNWGKKLADVLCNPNSKFQTEGGGLALASSIIDAAWLYRMTGRGVQMKIYQWDHLTL